MSMYHIYVIIFQQLDSYSYKDKPWATTSSKAKKMPPSSKKVAVPFKGILSVFKTY